MAGTPRVTRRVPEPSFTSVLGCCLLCVLSLGLIPLMLSWRLMEHHDATKAGGALATGTPHHPGSAPLLPQPLGGQRAAVAHSFNALAAQVASLTGGKGWEHVPRAPLGSRAVAPSFESALSDELARGGSDALIRKFTDFLARTPSVTGGACAAIASSSSCASTTRAVVPAAAAAAAAPATAASGKPSCESGGGGVTLFPGSDFVGGDLKGSAGLASVNSARGCCNACLRAPQCSTFVFKSEGGWCYLKRGAPTRRSAATLQAGVIANRASGSGAAAAAAAPGRGEAAAMRAPAQAVRLKPRDLDALPAISSLPPPPADAAWLSIGIPTVPRPTERYLTTTIKVLLSQLPESRSAGPLFGSVKIVVMNMAVGAHAEFDALKALYAAPAHPKGSYLTFLENKTPYSDAQVNSFFISFVCYSFFISFVCYSFAIHLARHAVLGCAAGAAGRGLRRPAGLESPEADAGHRALAGVRQGRVPVPLVHRGRYEALSVRLQRAAVRVRAALVCAAPFVAQSSHARAARTARRSRLGTLHSLTLASPPPSFPRSTAFPPFVAHLFVYFTYLLSVVVDSSILRLALLTVPADILRTSWRCTTPTGSRCASRSFVYRYITRIMHAHNLTRSP